MGIFDKKEKKLKQEFGKKHLSTCKEAVKEMEELHEDLKSAYGNIDTVVAEFVLFVDSVNHKLDEENAKKLAGYTKKISKVDKCARDAVRDVADVLRNHKKRLKEVTIDLKD
jgi:archaellum component FlaC